MLAPVGKRMTWEQQREWWARMVDLAEETRTPLVFYVHDPTDLPSSAVLMAGLGGLIEGRTNRRTLACSAAVERIPGSDRLGPRSGAWQGDG